MPPASACPVVGPLPFLAAFAAAFYFTIAQVHLARHLRSRPTLFSEPITGKPVRQRSPRHGGAQLVARAFWALVVIAALAADDLTLRDLTVGGTAAGPLAVLGGSTVYGIFAIVWTYTVGWFVDRRHNVATSYLLFRHFIPRRGKALALLGNAVVNPIFEELAFRFVLVHLVSCAAHSLVVGLAIGIPLSVAIHVYQGWRSLPSHLLFALLATLVMYSPLGLLGAVSMHAAADLAGIVQSRDVLSSWRSLVKSTRQERAG